MLRSVLIANRGEIAVRIIRTARALGMRTIAVYSEADRDALHVRLADEAHLLGPAPAPESYLNLGRLMEVARQSGAECLHPGYGFLSERAELPEACAAAGIAFVGPPAAAMRAMGLKSEAKTLMAKAGVPIIPGYFGDNQEPKFLRQKAYEIGYPVLIKAIAGGGGRGMRRVEKAIEFDAALAGAMREAESAFGDPRVMIEKYVASPRHVEVQVFADGHGNIVHLYERDCSLQRRHQKVIEETPAPGISLETRDAMGRAAIEAARAVGYVGAGTVEFLAEGRELKPGGFWFLEMNTRLQVEHPVTEAVTGVDLVEWQFRVAAGEKLPLKQSEIRIEGHAVEARLYAEDPERGFLPSIGQLHALQLPEGEGIRIDSGVESGAEIVPYYDPLLAKIIAHGRSREAAFNRVAKALAETMVIGPRCNVAFLRALVILPQVRDGRVDTGLIDRELAALAPPRAPDHGAAARAVERLVARERSRVAGRAARRSNERHSVWDALGAFALSGTAETGVAITVDGERAAALVRYAGAEPQAHVDGERAADCLVVDVPGAAIAWRNGRQTIVALADAVAVDLEHLDASGLVTAPMHGKVLSLEVAAGDEVKKGQRLLVLEAMKMEHALTAPVDGQIAELLVAAGDQVAEDAKLLVIEPAQTEKA
jgi:3-methylcrotonyl-CoA carboxylase alpha subunit